MQPESTFVKANALFDHLILSMDLKNDAALCRKINTIPPVVSKMRHGKRPVGAAMIISIHEVTGMPIKEIKSFLA